MALAQNAPRLAARPVLSGWLHRTTQNLAANTVRSDVRRRAREQEAAAMNELHEADAVWEHIAPHLDEALGELSEADRDALVPTPALSLGSGRMVLRLLITPVPEFAQ